MAGFPSHTFKQEFEDIQQTCTFVFDEKKVNFDVFEAVPVNGVETHPLFAFLKKEIPCQAGNEYKGEGTNIFGTEDIRWNFTSFLLSKEGKPVKRYDSLNGKEQKEYGFQSPSPLSFEEDVRKELLK